MEPPAHTLIYTHGGGRLGNQIIRFAHWLAWARAHAGEVEVVNLSFWSFARYFSGWNDHPGSVFPLRPGRADRWARMYTVLPERWRMLNEKRAWLPRAVQAAGRRRSDSQVIALNLAQGESIDLDDPVFFERVCRQPLTFCSGWKIASWRLFAEQESGLRGFFRPAPAFAQRAAGFIGALRRQHDVIIGLLIRQTDYREWDDGRFYFSTAQYVTWIRQLLDLHAGRRVAVVVAADEWQDPAAFAGLPCHFATGSVNSGGEWFESWVELSLCDLVVSAPSTFSATAAFLGAIPLWPVGAADQALAFEQLIGGGLAGAARHPVFSKAVK